MAWQGLYWPQDYNNIGQPGAQDDTYQSGILGQGRSLYIVHLRWEAKALKG